MKTADYLDAAKKKLGISSDYELAKRLAVSTATMSNYRKGKRAFDNTMAVKIAEILGIADWRKVIAHIELERGSNDAFWRRVLGKVAAIAGAALAIALYLPAKSVAAVLSLNVLLCKVRGFPAYRLGGARAIAP